MRRITLVMLLGGAGIAGYFVLQQPPADGPQTQAALKAVAPIVDSVRAASFPQLNKVEIALRPMRSDYIYFEGRFTFSSFFFAHQLRYMILFNPETSQNRTYGRTGTRRRFGRAEAGTKAMAQLSGNPPLWHESRKERENNKGRL